MARKSKYSTSVVHQGNKSKKLYYIAAIIILAIVLITSLVKSLHESLFFSEKDRINFVIYGLHTQVYSIGTKTAGNYIISYEPDLKLQVPGGYGYYRTGALGKLIYWEKKPELLTNTFSLATNSFVDYYYYPNNGDVYFGEDEYFSLPSRHDIMFLPSNANFFDKLYLAFYFINTTDAEFKHISVQSTKNKIGDRMLDTEQFESKYTGYLFEESYRNDRKSIQILYKDKYVNADRVAKVIQGNGIRVSDMSSTIENVKGCYLQEDELKPSLTAISIMKFFGCTWKKGKTDLYDILFILGDKEQDWEIND